jgi:hypothetical protein
MPTAKALRLNVLGDKAPDLQVAAAAIDSAIAATEAGPVSHQAARKVKDAETAAREAEQVRAQLEQIVKDRRHDRESRDSRGDTWAADSILGRDSFLRPDSRIDAQVDIDIR